MTAGDPISLWGYHWGRSLLDALADIRISKALRREIDEVCTIGETLTFSVLLYFTSELGDSPWILCAYMLESIRPHRDGPMVNIDVGSEKCNEWNELRLTVMLGMRLY